MIKTGFKNKGFTLVEVVVSVTILAIILLTFGTIFVFTNQTAISSNEKLVALHLARGTLERLKVDPEFYDDKIKNGEVIIEEINDKKYYITIHYQLDKVSSQNEELVPVLIEVKKEGHLYPISVKVEGYVKKTDSTR